MSQLWPDTSSQFQEDISRAHFQEHKMVKDVKSFKFIGTAIVQFLSSSDGEDFVESILRHPLSFERGRIFTQRRDRLWSLTSCWGRLWDNCGSSLILLREEGNVLALLSSVLHAHLVAGRYSEETGKILTIRRVPLTSGTHMFDLFINLVLLPEMCIEMAKVQFSTYKMAEEQFLRFSKRLIQVITYNPQLPV